MTFKVLRAVGQDKTGRRSETRSLDVGRLCKQKKMVFLKFSEDIFPKWIKQKKYLNKTDKASFQVQYRSRKKSEVWLNIVLVRQLIRFGEKRQLGKL